MLGLGVGFRANPNPKGRFKRSDVFSLYYSLFETLIHRRLSETPIINKTKDWLLGPRFYFNKQSNKNEISILNSSPPEEVGPKASPLCQPTTQTRRATVRRCCKIARPTMGDSGSISKHLRLDIPNKFEQGDSGNYAKLLFLCSLGGSDVHRRGEETDGDVY